MFLKGYLIKEIENIFPCSYRVTETLVEVWEKLEIVFPRSWSSSACCFAAMPATMVKSSFNCGFEGKEETASTCTGRGSATVGQLSARNRWVNSTISSSDGVGLCSNILSLIVGGRPLISRIAWSTTQFWHHSKETGRLSSGYSPVPIYILTDLLLASSVVAQTSRRNFPASLVGIELVA